MYKFLELFIVPNTVEFAWIGQVLAPKHDIYMIIYAVY